MLPFKKRDDAAAQGDDEPIKMQTKEYGMLDAIAQDMLSAIEKRDSAVLKSALESLCEYIRAEDEEQDETTMGVTQ